MEIRGKTPTKDLGNGVFQTEVEGGIEVFWDIRTKEVQLVTKDYKATEVLFTLLNDVRLRDLIMGCLRAVERLEEE